MCGFDEAHHAIGETYQELIFNNTNIDKSCFFTATPKTANGIDMLKDCGKIVYDYPYLRGVAEGYLNPFEIRVDLFGENTNNTIYDSIARAYYKTGNNHILTFHSDVNTESPTSVRNFVNKKEMKLAFKRVAKEFPTLDLPTIQMVGFYSELKLIERRDILKEFDESTYVYILSSCETMGEGIDTKNANMCVFVDPKTSFVKIIQNIGRVVRKQFGVDKPHSTILLPIYIDKTKYEECKTAEECDAVIREQMKKGDDFTPILNVMSALKQEDEDLYDICLYYPNNYSPKELEHNFKANGYTIGEEQELEEIFDDDLEEVAERDNIQIDIHTDSLEEPIISYGESERVVSILQVEDKYCKIEGEEKAIKPPKRIRLDVHPNMDIQVLWKIENIDLGSCLLDCEVNEFNHIKKVNEIIERAKEREQNGGIRKPKKISRNIMNETELQEKKDASRLSGYKKILRGQTRWGKCPQEVVDLLDKEIPDWNIDNEYINIKLANQIIERAKERKKNGERLLPKQMKQIKQINIKLIQEDKDANLLQQRFKKNRYPKITDLLNKELPGWNTTIDDEAIKMAIDIVKRAKEREKNGGRLLPRELDSHDTPELHKEWQDCVKLSRWKRVVNKGDKNGRCCKQVISILDEGMPSWRIDLSIEQKAIKYAEEIIQRANDRIKNGKYLLPKNKPNSKGNKILELEHKDARKLDTWKQSLNGNKKAGILFDSVKNLLDMHLPNWNNKPYNISIPNTKKFYDNLEEFKIFLDTEKRKPVEKDEIYNRFQNNNRNYKNKTQIMKIEEIRKLWEEFLEEYKEYLNPKKSMTLKPTKEPKESTEEKRQRIKTEISELHQKYKTLTSANLSKLFEDKTKWEHYHTISERNEESFPQESIPRNQIITELDKIKTKRPKKVVDMGCGKANISKHFNGDKRFEFTNYDHVANDDSVKVCDISHIPLEDDSAEICILSLAMWGSNCKEYIKEAHRILETNGTLYIIEPTKRWTNEEPADRLRELLTGFKIITEKIEKFTMFIAVKI
jgi:hypothetical protein